MRALFALPMVMVLALAGCGAENKTGDDKSHPTSENSEQVDVSLVKLKLPGMV